LGDCARNYVYIIVMLGEQDVSCAVCETSVIDRSALYNISVSMTVNKPLCTHCTPLELYITALPHVEPAQ